MPNPTCPACHSARQVIKSGLNDSGSQRYRCQACRRYFTPVPKPAGYDHATRNFALKLYLEGASLRAIGRLLHINYQTAANWVNAQADQLPEQVSDHTPTQNVEIDELFTFMGKKKAQVYVVLAVARASYLIVGAAVMEHRTPEAMQDLAA